MLSSGSAWPWRCSPPGRGSSASVAGFHDESAITREVFGNIPAPLKVAFYTVIPILLVYGAVLFANRAKNWQRGRPDNRRTTPKTLPRRLADFRAGAYMRTLLREPGAGVMHSLIYFSFLILLGVTTTLEVNHQLPDALKFLHGDVYKAYSAVGDAAGAVFVAGMLWALLRRFGPPAWRPYRIRIKTRPEHLVIALVLLSIGITGFGAEAFRIAADGLPEHERWSFIGYPLAELVQDADAVHGWHQAWWIAHVVAFMAFLVILPTTMLRHMLTSPLNMYLRDRDRPKGAMRPMPDLVEGETELETFGASVIEDFSWKQLLDTDACTMCGRCTSVCPAHLTGKPLDPREIVLKTGEVMALTGDPPTSPPLGVGKAEGDTTVRGAGQLDVRPDQQRRAVGVHLVSSLRRDLPCQHRDTRQDPRHAPIPDPHGQRLPVRTGTSVSGHGELFESMVAEPKRTSRLGEGSVRREGDRRRRPVRSRIPLLGRMRRLFRRQEQACRTGDGTAHGTRRRGLRDPRACGELHGRLGTALRQRIPVPNARIGEHRDAQLDGRAQDRHPMPSLLQHARQRIPATRRSL